MRKLTLLSILSCLTLLAVPSTSHAVGISASLGGGALIGGPGGTALKAAVEVSPFYDIAVLRLEIPVELTLQPDAGSIAIRPGVKVFIPIVGIYGRAGFGIGGLGKGATNKHLVLGAGWQLSLLDTVGIFFEGSYEPYLDPSGPKAIMGRAGAMLNF